MSVMYGMYVCVPGLGPVACYACGTAGLGKIIRVAFERENRDFLLSSSLLPFDSLTEENTDIAKVMLRLILMFSSPHVVNNQ